jgi:hypothetical protein
MKGFICRITEEAVKTWALAQGFMYGSEINLPAYLPSYPKMFLIVSAIRYIHVCTSQLCYY